MDKVIHSLRETYAFLEVSQSKKRLIDVLQENQVCSNLLKMINESLNSMIARKRENLLRDGEIQRAFSKPSKLQAERYAKVMSQEYESNVKLIEHLQNDLENLSMVKLTVDNPG